MTRTVVGVVLALVGLVLLAGPAAAGERATATDVRRLAAQAVDDPSALDHLRQIDDVDGRRVDLGAILAGDGARTRARLRTLAGGAPTRPSADPRAQARRILAGQDFRRHPVPRPLRGPFRWLGARLRPVTDPVRRFLDRLDARGWLATAVAAAVVLAAGIGGMLTVRRRDLAVVGGGGGWRGGAGRESPESLERQADRAERSGDHETALRLRFQAGLLRLDAAGVLRYRPSLTTGAVTRQVRSTTLARLATTVDEVVYGGRPASPDDVEAARRSWPDVLAEARAR
jgi:hypothetical protein